MSTHDRKSVRANVMRMPRLRMTFRQCMLAGFLLIAALLSVAALRSWLLLEQHVERSRINGAQALLLSTAIQEIAERTVDLERGARQYLVLRDPAVLARVDESGQRCLALLQQLETMTGPTLAGVSEAWRSTLVSLRQELTRAPRSNAVLGTLVALTRLNAELEQQGRRWVDTRSQALIDELAASRVHVAFIVGGAVLGAFAIALAMNWWLSRPVEKLQGSIRRLGESRLEEPVRVHGPVDMQLIGQRLEWLRRRLRDLEAERERALRHVAHELKTPLTALREGISLLKDEVGGTLGTTQKEIVDILQHNVVTLQRHIESLLRLNSVSNEARSLNVQAIDLPTLLEKAVQDRALQIQGRNLTVATTAPERACPLDEEKMLVVLDNLLSNAIDFSPEYGQIRLEASVDGPYLRLLCADDGDGVAEVDAERIFEPFVQGQRQPPNPRQGSGVGLSIVRELVLAMGGSVRLLPQERGAKGAAFEIVLPVGDACLWEAA